MIEAMECGTPPIASCRGAAREISVDGETGFLVKDLDEMVAAVHRPDSIDPWRCRARVEERFSPAALADQNLAIHEKILGVKEPAMTARTIDPSGQQQSKIARLLLSLHLQGLDSVRLRILSREIILEGSVPSYELKCKVEKQARGPGFSIQNCLRVIPGVVYSSSNAHASQNPVPEADRPA